MEIVTDKQRKPSVTWLSFVKTTRAKEVIKSYINKEQREELVEKGKTILNSYLEKHFGKGLDKEMSMIRNLDGRVLDMKGKEDVLLQVGNLSRKPSSVIRAIREALGASHVPTIKPQGRTKTGKVSPDVPETPSTELIIGGAKGIPHRIANCCSPKPGDRVVGYSSRLGITIHKVECGSLRKGTFDRFMPASWGGKERSDMQLKVEMLFENRIGVLRKLTDILYLMRINILEISQKAEDGGKRARILFCL